ncbi:MoaD/ThiS family protein [Candidatus Woesearchaeota archaeon]|nr:MoaD/ThiS family protein [Candidatus Woesearchaeota archaeon]
MKIEFTGDVKGLLEKLKINPETVIVVRDDELLTDDVVLKNNDKIKVLSVISGG